MASSSVCRYVSNENETNSDGEDREVTYYVTLESSSEIDSSDVESIESFQANTTVSAKDTSDLSTSDYIASELEVIDSTDSGEMAFLQDPLSTSDSAKDIRLNLELSMHDSDSNLSDVSSFKSDASGLFETNQFYRTCSQCSEVNLNPAYRFCTSCYQERKKFFPEKPKRKNKKRKCSNSSNSAKRPKLDEPSGDSESVSTALTQDSGFESGDWPIETIRKCMTCLDRVPDALFLHGPNLGHQGFCYRCAKKMWDQSTRCPICRRRIYNVVRIMNP